jgi:hypothetical protein
MKPIASRTGRRSWTAIVKETINQDMTLISGIPPWVQMYFDRLQEKSGKKIQELFPSFFGHGAWRRQLRAVQGEAV